MSLKLRKAQTEMSEPETGASLQPNVVQEILYRKIANLTVKTTFNAS